MGREKFADFDEIADFTPQETCLTDKDYRSRTISPPLYRFRAHEPTAVASPTSKIDLWPRQLCIHSWQPGAVPRGRHVRLGRQPGSVGVPVRTQIFR